MEVLENKTEEKKLPSGLFIKFPCPDWKKRVEIDIAYSMIQPSFQGNDFQDYDYLS